MNTEETTTEKIDLSQLTFEQLQEEMAKRKNEKESDRTTYKQLVEETVPKVIFKLATASEILSNAKTESFKFFEDILDLKAKAYGIKEGQMSHTFSCDNAEVTIGYRINDGWDDTVNAGTAKVEQFLSSLAKDNNSSALVKTVFKLLNKDANGNLNSKKVLELQKMSNDFKSEVFDDGVKIILDAFKPRRSVWFVDANLINEDGSKVSIPLSMSAVDFSKGYKFEFFNDKIKEDGGSN